MKKILSSFLVLIAATLMASAGFAGQIQLGTAVPTAFPTTIGPYVPTPITEYMYPAEAAVKSVTIDFATGLIPVLSGPTGVVPVSPVGKSIFYQPSTNLPTGTRIFFTLVNGTFPNVNAPGDLYLIGRNVTATPGSQFMSMADFDSKDTSVPGQVTYKFIVGMPGIPVLEQLLFSTSKTSAVSPLVAFNGTNLPPTVPVSPLVTPNAVVTLSVQTVFDDLGDIAGAHTAAAILIRSYQQFAWVITMGSGNVEIPISFRTRFDRVSPPFPPQLFPYTPGTVQLRDASVTLPVLTGFRIDLASGHIALLTYTVNGNQLSKLSGTGNGLVLNPGGNVAYPFTVGLPVPFNLASTDATTTISHYSDNSTDAPNVNAENVVFTVNGVAILNMQVFQLLTQLDFQAGTLSPIDLAWYVPNTTPNLMGNGPIMQWTIATAWQGTIPYMFASSDPTQDGFIKLFNNSDAAASVYVDVYPDLGNYPGPHYPGVPPANISPIPILNVIIPNPINPQGTGIIWASAIRAAANLVTTGAPLLDNSAFAVVVTVDVKPSMVTGVAVQKRPAGSGDRVLPIYTGWPGLLGMEYKHY